MDICYVILAHKYSPQVQQLVQRLNAKNCFFYIHVDATVSLEPFTTKLSILENVWFIKEREQGTWGGLGIVKATLNALHLISSHQRKGYCILLSGQDYPLKNNQYILEYLQTNRGTNFADTWALPSERWYYGGMDRIQQYKFDLASSKQKYIVIPSIWSRLFHRHPAKNLRKVIKLLKSGVWPVRLLLPRRFPSGLKPFGGSQWWAITTETAEKIIFFVKNHRSYLHYHKFTLLPDEIFFQSLIRHFSALENSSLKPSLTYVRFATQEDAHPVAFTMENKDELHEVRTRYEGKLFARKFHPNDPILDWLDSQ